MRANQLALTVIITLISFLSFFSANAQTTYIGANNGDFNTASNWTNGVPGPGNNGLIPGGGVNVVISTATTMNYSLEIYSSLTATSSITIGAQGNVAAAGTLTMNAGSSLTNNGTFNNFGTATFTGTASFTNAANATFTNGGTFTLPGTLNNSGNVTNNGTLNAANGLIQTQGTFSNNQTMTVKSLIISANSQFVNNFGANLTVSGTGAIFDAAGNVTNNGTVTLAAASTITGVFDNNVTLIVEPGFTLNVPTAGRINNGGTVQIKGTFTNSGTVFNNNNFYNEGTSTNYGTFAQNNRLENRLGAIWNNEGGSTMNMGFGALILNVGTFNQRAEMISTGTITNDGTYNVSGSIINNSGGTIDNNKTFTNTGTITSFNTFTNDDVFNNDGRIVIGSGSILTNNKTFNNNTTGTIRNEFEIVNTTGATFTNSGRIENLIRIFVNGGTFSNLTFIDNSGDIFTKAGATLSNNGYLLQSAGNIKNEGSLSNAGTIYSDECSTINNTGTINSTGSLTLRGVLFQRGTLSGAAITNDGGFVHTGTTSAAPAVCATRTITADVNGIVKAYATGLITFATFDSCQNMIYTANGIARPTFACSDIGSPKGVNLKIVTRLQDSLTCVATVNPVDALAPDFANCPADITVTTPNNSVNVSWTAPTVTDNCIATPTLSLTKASGTSFNVGVTAVTYTATDAAGNTQQCQFKVNVVKIASASNCTNDVTGPVFTGCPGNLNVATDAPSTPVIWPAPTVADACQPLSVTTNFAPGTTFGQGKTTVRYIARDGNGNTGTCQFVVTLFKNDLCITDTQKPVYSTCPSNIYLPTNAALNGALAIWAAPQVGDNCAVTEQLASHQSGTVFPVGSTTVTYTAKDGANNTATCRFTVTVGADPCPGDVAGPTISACPANQSLNIQLGSSGTATWTAPTANDACGPVSLHSNYVSGAAFGVGVTQVTYTASDRKGNKSTCTFNITVNTPCSADATAPNISGCPANIIVGTSATSAAATWVAPVATDPCGVAGFTSSYTPGAIFPVGTTQVVYTASDFKGNTASCVFNVQVVNAPACTTNSSPINNATAIAPASVILTWNTAAGADRYDVYLGLTSTTMKLIAPDVAATSTTIDNLNGGTDYFWYVLPKNSVGAPASCTSFTKFTTSGTPQGGGTGGNPTQIDNNLPICVGSLGQGWTVQTWNNIGGVALTDLTTNVAYPNNPTSTVLVTNSKSTWNIGDNYGTRVRGFITPATSGSYIFTITGDDQTEFYLSPNTDPAAKVLRANVQDWSNETEYTKFAAMTSAAISLTAGQAYYVEILQKEGDGGDGWNLTWTGPGITTRTNIPLSRMSPIMNCSFTGGTAATSTVTAGSTSRTSNGLIALYDFKEGSGATVRDVSGFGTPLDLTIANTANVTRLSGSCGLRINTATVIKPTSGVSSSKLTTALTASNAITMEAWIKPANNTQSNSARIMTLSSSNTSRSFVMGQDAANYNIRLRTASTNADGSPSRIGGINGTGLQHVVYIRDASGYEALYVDNELISEGTRSGAFNFTSTHTFALGNELTDDFPWLGEMHLIAVYNRALSLSEIGQNYHVGVCLSTNRNVCSSNVMANGGFEQDFYGHWVTNGPTIITTPVAGGTKAARACNADSGFGETSRAIPGASYTMAAAAHVSNAPSWAAVGMKFLDINGAQIGGVIEKQVTNSSAYNSFTNIGVAPANVYWVEYYGWKTGLTGCLLVDNVCVKETNALCNTTLTVTNNGSCIAKLYWVNNGVEIFYADIAGGTTRKQPTFETHMWRVRRSSDAALIREITMSGCIDQTITISSCGTAGTPSTGGCPTDTQAPTFTGCPANLTVNASGTNTTATATWTAPTANDNCGTPLRASNFVPGATFNLGTTTVRYTAFDTRGNTATCQFTVTVANTCANDTQVPVFANCPANQTKTTSDVTTTVSWTAPTATDNCGTPVVTATATPGQYFAPGTSVVRYTAVDAKGNTATCQFNVVVNSTNECANDTQAPVITLCPSNQTVTTSATSAQVNWQSPFVADNCGLKSFVVNLIPGLFFPLGNTTVTYVATDVFDNQSTCSFVVTVNAAADPCATETTPPVLAGCPANRTVTAAVGATTATTTWTAPTATDNCPGAVTITSSHSSGAAFPIGNTTVTYTARDARNNSATCSFVVTVNAAADPCATETTPPVLSACPANITVTAAAAGATSTTATWTAPTATDNCPGAVTITSSHNSGAAFTIGNTTVTYTARDARNNSATCSFVVTVNAAADPCATETTPPVLSACPANITVTAAAGATSATATWTAPTATDNCPGLVTVTGSSAPGAIFAVGAHTVSYTATDARGNAATCTFSVTVNAAINPTDCGNIIIKPGPSSITVSGLTAPIAMIQIFNAQWVGVYNCAGNCNMPSQVINTLAAGTYFVKVDFLDASWGALCKKEEFVTVVAGSGTNGVLTFNAPANITVNAPAGVNQTTVTYPTPSATTTCTSGSLAVNRSSGIASGGIFPVGTTSVCYMATDGCGNSKEVCFNVVVNATGVGGNGDCNAITITSGNGSITVSGLVAPITYLQVFDGQFNQVFNCAGNCASPTQVVGSLAAGTYFVKASLADATWMPTCAKEQFVHVSAAGGATVLTFNAPANISVTAASNTTSAVVTYTEPTATTTCTTGTINYNRTQGLASGSAFPVGTTRICYSATDGCGNLKSVCFDVIVAENSSNTGPNCNTITFTPGGGSITIGNLVSPVVMIQLFDANYASVGSCVGNCNVPSQTFTGLTPGTYYAKVDFLNASWQPICQRNETVSVVSALAIPAQMAFNATKAGQSARLKWLSNTGQVNDYFEIERAGEDGKFISLGQKDGKGNADEMLYFQLMDHQPLEGANYYRLKQVKRDGSIVFSDVQKLDFFSLDQVVLAPNPAIDYTTIYFADLVGKDLDCQLINAQGQVVRNWQIFSAQEQVKLETNDFDSGVYMLKLQASDRRPTILKLVIQH